MGESDEPGNKLSTGVGLVILALLAWAAFGDVDPGAKERVETFCASVAPGEPVGDVD